MKDENLYSTTNPTVNVSGFNSEVCSHLEILCFHAKPDYKNDMKHVCHSTSKHLFLIFTNSAWNLLALMPCHTPMYGLFMTGEYTGVNSAMLKSQNDHYHMLSIKMDIMKLHLA